MRSKLVLNFLKFPCNIRFRLHKIGYETMSHKRLVNKDYSKIIKLVEFISSEHILFTKKFFQSQNNTPSLKNKQIRHFLHGSMEDNNVEIKIDFLSYILEYIDEISEYYTFELLMKLLEQNISIEHIREKNKDSIVSKIFHYRFGKDEVGRLATNKCLNDLLGFRIYIDEITDYEILKDDLMRIIGTKDSNNNRLKYYNACKNEYNAVHIYFDGINNSYFPWELQIWGENHIQTNLDSHKEHKLGYLEWKNFATDDIIEIVER
ncbi:hypothetical protein [Corticicoccus populi]|uniref:RelA/SpoT domain-containing protein n=1 Tax=Corticicoccus populi TaxID=1812821 RepID=A0ABW5WUQ9_9STAP